MLRGGVKRGVNGALKTLPAIGVGLILGRVIGHEPVNWIRKLLKKPRAAFV